MNLIEQQMNALRQQDEAFLLSAAPGQKPAAPAFRLDPPPKGWSPDWTRTQLQKLKAFNSYQRVDQELARRADDVLHQMRCIASRQPSFVREYMIGRMVGDHGLHTVFPYDELRSAWDYCSALHTAKSLFPDGNYNDAWKKSLAMRQSALTGQQKMIADLLWPNFDEWYRLEREARNQIASLDSTVRENAKQKVRSELDSAWDAFHAYLDSLPTQQKYAAGYEIARSGFSQGRSGFHGLASSGYSPFCACGWADYHDPSWGDSQGVAFRIETKCFAGRDVLLYYSDDDGFPQSEASLDIIRECSSGIADVRVEPAERGRYCGGRRIVFRLDESAIRETVRLSGEDVPTGSLGGYVFMLPRAGEFYCELGEIIDGAVVPLHIDDFCMK